MAQHLQEIAWLPEPHVAEAIFREMLRQAGVTVLFHRRLREKDGVRKTGARLEAITMENGEVYTARVFADCTYEGDLMAQSGVNFTWGRESGAQYGEWLAGVRGETPKHQFLVDLSPYGAGGKLLPEISAEPAGEPGAADRKVQAYNFRMILSHDDANQVPYPKPAAYDAARYDLFARLLDAMLKKQGRASRLGEVISISPIPNHKADMNNNGPFSISAGRGSTPTRRTRDGRRSGATTKNTPRASSGFWRTIRACLPNYRRKPTSGDWRRTSSPTTRISPTSFTSGRRGAWWASTA